MCFTTEEREFGETWREVEALVLSRCRRHRSLLRRVGEEEQDVAQEVRIGMLRAYRRDGTVGNPRALAYRITECRLKDRLRGTGPELVELTEAAETRCVSIAPPTVEVETREADQEFAELRLYALDEIEDAALALREAGAHRKQIAARLRIPEPDVKPTLQRARRKLEHARTQRDARGLCSMLAPAATTLRLGVTVNDERRLAAARHHLSRCRRCHPSPVGSHCRKLAA